MKIYIYSDVHISSYSSILRSRSETYSTRLSYIIKSIEWVERKIKELSTSQDDIVVNLGDVFDKAVVNAEELTSISYIPWGEESEGFNNLDHYIIVGNHDSNTQDLYFNTANVLNLHPLFKDKIFYKPTTLHRGDVDIHFLPYVTESKRKSLEEYFDFDLTKKNIILSHNDISGVQMGGFLSKDGFKVEDILNSSTLYLNGHLHNSAFISPDRLLNVGNLCGMNFSEDASKYKHGLWEVDCDTLELKFYENPYALNFYKVLINDEVTSLDDYELGNNCVLMIKCERKQKENLEKELSSTKYLEKIVCYKITYYDEELSDTIEEKQHLRIEKIDQYQTFKDFIRNSVGNTEPVNEEIEEIWKHRGGTTNETNI